MPDDYTPPADGDFEPSGDWLTYMSTSNYPWFTDWLAAHDAELRETVARELLRAGRESADAQHDHDRRNGLEPLGTSTANEVQWHQMANWAARVARGKE